MEEQRSVVDIICERVDKGDVTLPVFDRTALRIQEELAKEDPDLGLIERMITIDPALTGQLLRMANSSFYKGLSKVTSVRNAIVRLGVGEISNIVTLVAHRRYFVSKDPFVRGIMAQLWRHSVGCAIGSRWIAERVGFEAPSHEAFFAGLLHDVGKLFILAVLQDLRKQNGNGFLPSEGVVGEIFSSLHCDQGFTLMNNWNLPEKYCVIARDHHLEEFDPHHFLLGIVRMANSVCNKAGIGLNTDADIVLSASAEADLLGLSEVDIARLEIHLEDSRALSE